MILLAGCGTSGATRPWLQSLASMQPLFHQISMTEAAAALDMRALQASLARSDERQILAAAFRLARGGRVLRGLTARAGYTLRTLSHVRGSPAERRYVRIALAAVMQGWWEGHELSKLARLAVHDPYLTSGSDGRQALHLSAAASFHALTAQRESWAANAWLRAHRRSFRYHPVSSGR